MLTVASPRSFGGNTQPSTLTVRDEVTLAYSAGKLIKSVEKQAPPEHAEQRGELYADLKARLRARRFAEALYVINAGYQIRNAIDPRYWARRRRLIRDLNRAIAKFRSDPIVQSAG